jgi:radical SAM protein with 4Fe4S-binding SPASM domain
MQVSVATTLPYEAITEETAVRYQQLVTELKGRCLHEPFFKLSKKLLPGRHVSYERDDNRAYYEYNELLEERISPNARYYNFIMGHPENEIQLNCGFGGISVASDGEVYFCNRTEQLESYGNVKSHPLKYFLEMGRQLHRQTDANHMEPCNTCHLRTICNGSCRIDFTNFKGRMQSHTGPLRQDNCEEKFVLQLEDRMVGAFRFFYDIR